MRHADITEIMDEDAHVFQIAIRAWILPETVGGKKEHIVLDYNQRKIDIRYMHSAKILSVNQFMVTQEVRNCPGNGLVRRLLPTDGGYPIYVEDRLTKHLCKYALAVL
jgi:hypothetical protein